MKAIPGNNGESNGKITWNMECKLVQKNLASKKKIRWKHLGHDALLFYNSVLFWVHQNYRVILRVGTLKKTILRTTFPVRWELHLDPKPWSRINTNLPIEGHLAKKHLIWLGSSWISMELTRNHFSCSARTKNVEQSYGRCSATGLPGC